LKGTEISGENLVAKKVRGEESNRSQINRQKNKDNAMHLEES
jgi:hypothetical protein